MQYPRLLHHRRAALQERTVYPGEGEEQQEPAALLRQMAQQDRQELHYAAAMVGEVAGLRLLRLLMRVRGATEVREEAAAAAGGRPLQLQPTAERGVKGEMVMLLFIHTKI